jgi:hypothetical protein
MPRLMERATNNDVAAMRETVASLASFANRGPGTDPERRAALWLAPRLREATGRRPRLEVHWVRPQRAAMLALHIVVAVAASLLAVSAPAVAAGVLGLVLVSLAADASGRLYIGRRITPERATQHVVASPPKADKPVLLVIAASCDAPAGGALRGPLAGRALAAARRFAGGRAPGAYAWLALAVTAILACAVARSRGVDSSALGALQLVPTVALLPAFALLVDAALTPRGPGANADGSGVAVALALARALRADPPERLAVEVALMGASAGTGLGARGYVARRRHASTERVALLELKPCGRGRPHWWRNDGELFPLAFHPGMRSAAQDVAEAHPELGARPLRGRGGGIALAARERGWPALALGALGADGAVPSAGRADDVAERVDDISLKATYELALAVVRRLDEEVSPSGRRERRPPGDVTTPE